MTRYILAAFILIGVFFQSGPGATQVASAQAQDVGAQTTDAYQADLQLAQHYVPVFYFHPDEVYLPLPVEVIMGVSRLRQSRRMWFDINLLNSFTAQDLLAFSSDESCFLDQWFGDTGSSEYANYTSHRQIYESILRQAAGKLEPQVYAHVIHHQNPEYTTIQYWLFYFYNDWFNKHEGDWELVEVILLDGGQPAWVVYSQHHGGVRRSWSTTPMEDGTHPVVYVARGSHANYFVGNQVYPFPQVIGNRQLVLADRTGTSGRLVPKTVLIPTRAELAADPHGWPGAEWLAFRGRWGETAVYGDFNGPSGPADKGLQWEDPYVWGILQPLDGGAWYQNRLKVEVDGLAASQAQVWLVDENGQKIAQSESIGNLAILHEDPPGQIRAQVAGLPGALGSIMVYWPDPGKKTVTRMSFLGLTLDASGQAQLALAPGQAVLHTAGQPLSLPSRLVETYATVWDAPDSPLVGGILPVNELLAGLVLCLLISLLPVLVLAAILYWVDRYQKEPIRLLVAAFIWGAIPALLVSFSMQLFVKIPPNLMGLNALEVIRLGLLAPVVEEILKAAGVFMIFWRFRKEFNDVLDGMIYGALVGFGFAFISNLFRYAGDFFTLGFPALNLGFVALRTVHVLNHGLYTASFGACLGFATMARSRTRFWGWIMLGLVLAIATHALQNLLSNSLVGMNVFTVIVTGSGILLLCVVAGRSLVMQRRLLRSELQGVVHDSLYGTVQNPVTRLKAQWHALRRQGFRAWLQMRRLQGLCIRLAYARLHPENYRGSGEIEQLQSEIKHIFDALNPVAQ